MNKVGQSVLSVKAYSKPRLTVFGEMTQLTAGGAGSICEAKAVGNPLCTGNAGNNGQGFFG